MKLSNIYVENKKEILALSKLKLPLKKSTEKLLLQKAITRNTDYYSIVQLWRGKIIERVFAVRLNRKNIAEYQEVIRKIEGNGLAINKNMYYGNLTGYKTVWSDSRPSHWYFNKDYAYNKWFTCKVNYYNVYVRYLFTLDDLKKLDPSLRYCAWNGQPITDFISLYRKWPEIEMLSKIGMSRLMYNSYVLKKMREDTAFKKYLYRCGGNNQTTGKDVLYGYKNNQTLPQVAAYRAEQARITFIKGLVRQVIYHYSFIDSEKLFTYFDKYCQKHKHHINANSYVDMIRAEQFLHIDLTQEKNLFPHDFQYWHNHYTKQFQIAINVETDININKQAVKYKKLEKEVGGLKLILAKNTEELIHEGEVLSHCVGRMGYNKKMAEGKTLILFVRKEEEVETPYVTMEYDPNKKKILQLYGEHDHQPEETTKEIIYKQWLPKIQRLRFA